MDRIWYNEIGITRIYKDWPIPKTENFFSFDEGYSDSNRFIDSELPDNEQVAFILGLFSSENISIEREQAQEEVDQKLAKTLYDLTGFIKKKFLLSQEQIDQITAMTTVAQLKNVILDRFSLTPEQEDYIEDFRVSYEALITAKE